MPWKIHPILNFEILGMFVNRLTADENDPFRYFGDFQFPSEIQLSEKQRTIFQFFVRFMESPSNFKYFRIKDDRDS